MNTAGGAHTCPWPSSTFTSPDEHEGRAGPLSHIACSKRALWGGGPLCCGLRELAYRQLWILRPMVSKWEQEEASVFLDFLSKFPSLSPSLAS